MEYPIEWWDFNFKGTLNKRSGTILSDSAGRILLNLDDLPAIDGSPVVDTAVKIGEYDGILMIKKSSRLYASMFRRLRNRK
jgi:hypothetical protein